MGTVVEMPWLVPIPIPTQPWYKKLIAPFVKRNFGLAKDFYYYNGDGILCVIPGAFIPTVYKGVVRYILKDHIFSSDGKSYPRIIWWLLSQINIGLIEGLVHDFCYRYRCQITSSGEIINKGMTRKQADRELYLVGMRTNGIQLSSSVGYGVLRVFGCFAWRKHRTGDGSDRNNPYLLLIGGIKSVPCTGTLTP